jgi:hypothetical protein
MLRDSEVICGLVGYPASLLHSSRPAQGGVRALITLLGPKALMCIELNECCKRMGDINQIETDNCAQLQN